MAAITLDGEPILTIGQLPKTGSRCPGFFLTKSDLTDVGLHDFDGMRLVFNIFTSIDTSVCAASVRRFNEAASSLDNTAVLCVSQDLPFAHARFCGAEGIENVILLSSFRSKSFGTGFGVTMIEGPLAGLFSRAVVITDSSHIVTYTEQVPENSREPDYAKALKVLELERQ